MLYLFTLYNNVIRKDYGFVVSAANRTADLQKGWADLRDRCNVFPKVFGHYADWHVHEVQAQDNDQPYYLSLELQRRFKEVGG